MKRSHRLLIAIGGVTLVVLLAVVALSLFNRPAHPEPSADHLVTSLTQGASVPTFAGTVVEPSSLPTSLVSPLQTTLPTITNLPPATQNILVVNAVFSSDNIACNFNPFYSGSPHKGNNLIFETLMVKNYKNSTIIPWLATGYTWSDGYKTLTFTIRKGVRWSDGEPFTARDVAFTYNLIKEHPEISGDTNNTYWSTLMNSILDQVYEMDDYTVVFKFKKANVLSLYDLLRILIVPQHKWQGVKDYQHFANEKPVGTGPFTQVTQCEVLTTPILEERLQMERNPYYWQPGKPAFQGIRFSGWSDEDRQAKLLAGGLDVSYLDIPDFQNLLRGIDPAIFHVAINGNGIMTVLYPNTSKPYLSNKDVRKAISMAIDREQLIKDAPISNPTPANSTGLSDQYQTWLNQDAIQNGVWTKFNPAQANAILDRLGFQKGANGLRTDPEGKPFKLDVITDSGIYYLGTFEDTLAQKLVSELKNVGLDSSYTPFDPIVGFSSIENQNYLVIDPVGAGFTPYEFYQNMMSASGRPFFSTKTNQEANFYYSPLADQLLNEFTLEPDVARQKSIMDQLQVNFVADAPAIPLFVSYNRYEYLTNHFTGFPSGLSTDVDNDPLSILTILNLKPTRGN